MTRAFGEGSLENMDLEPDRKERGVGLDEQEMRAILGAGDSVSRGISQTGGG